LKPTVILDGLSFPECPRWHDGSLWFSEKRGRRIVRASASGEIERIIETDDEPGGLGWLPDGRLIVVAQIGRRLLRLDGERFTELADLSALTGGKCNDMVVHSSGNAYVGHFGFDLGAQTKLASLIMVTPSGRATVAVDAVDIPNGAEFTADGRTLILAETGARRLTAFDVADDGTLSGRRVFAELAPSVADGICLDASGAVWIADPLAGEVARVLEGGEITHRIPVGGGAPFACTLGGPDGRSLFICTDELTAAYNPLPTGNGQVAVVTVDVPAAD
jgi:sugar lactone lactonase YvrE